jgi:phosphatidylglycerophosphatase A
MYISSNLEKIELTKFDMPLATVLGIGKIKYAPGTFGSIAALITLLINEDLFLFIAGIMTLVLFIISIHVINRIESNYGYDPGFIVIDEFIGMTIVLLNPLVPHNPLWIFIGFILFRFFDIFKPYPISIINDKKGAFYVMFDDIVAGLFSAILTTIFFISYQILPFFWIFLKKI